MRSETFTEEIGREVDQKVRKYQDDFGEKDYEVAMTAVLDADPDLKERYSGVYSEPGEEEFSTEDDPQTVRAEVNVRVEALCSERGWDLTEKYDEAMELVFQEDPKLKVAYANS